MRSTRCIVLAVAVFTLVLTGMPSIGRSQDNAPKPPATQPGQQDMMAVWMKAMTPGKPHEIFKQMVGTYDTTVKFKMSADAPEQQSTGLTTNEIILGGRYLKSDYTGDMFGQQFHGLGLAGYDNVKKKYVSMWLDEMSTGPMVAEGTADDTGKVLTLTGEYPDAATGIVKQYRQVTTITDADHHKFELFEIGPAGEEFRMMEITYTKKK